MAGPVRCGAPVGMIGVPNRTRMKQFHIYGDTAGHTAIFDLHPRERAHRLGYRPFAGEIMPEQTHNVGCVKRLTACSAGTAGSY